MNHTSWRIRRLVVLALLVALSFAAVAFVRIPVVLFLKYEPKDVLLTIGSFLFGPIAGILTCITVALLELVTISDTGLIGFAMNILSSGLFVCTASLIYSRKRTLSGALIGLICGTVAMTSGMLLWNYLITPLYMNVPRAMIADMLLTVFLPFNLLKGITNAALTVALYKTVSNALRSAHLLPPVEVSAAKKTTPIWLFSLLVVIPLILVMLIWSGII